MSYHILIPAMIIRPFIRAFNWLQDLGLLATRLWVAKIFLDSALTKIAYWPSTIILFKYTYAVPFLSPTSAAYIGTFAEFLFPILMILGLGGRLAVFAFFIYNIVCVVSFRFLWTPAGAAGFSDHVSWGLLLLLVMFFGMGRFSLDELIHKKFGYLIRLGSWKEARVQFHRHRSQSTQKK